MTVSNVENSNQVRNLASSNSGSAKQISKANRWPRIRTRLSQLMIVAIVLLSWEFASGRILDNVLVSRPSEVFPELWSWIVTGDLVYHAVSTFQNAVFGLLAGVAAGLIVGVVLGESKRLSNTFEPFITALYTMPKHALIPLFIMWVGIGAELRILTAASIVFFVVFYNTFFGVRDVSENLQNSVKTMGGSFFDVLFRVTLPSALIWVVAAMKMAVPQGIVGVVVAEMLAGDRGLGYLVALNAGTFNSAGTFAGIFVLLVFGYVIDRLVTICTSPALAWKLDKQ